MCRQVKPSISLLVAVLKVRENAGDQVVIGFSFASDWFRVARPITERSDAKLMESRITFHTQLKIVILHQSEVN